jgi:cytochrome c oxidase subunit 2
MKELFVIATTVMIFVIIFQISKASEYVSVLKGEEKTRKQNNKINAFMLIAFLVLGLIGAWYCNELYYKTTLFPQGSGSVEGEEVDFMLKITILVTGVVFVLTQVLLFWFSFKYQEKDDRKAFFFPHNTKLELIWTTVPAIFLTVLVVFGLKFWFKVTGEPPVGHHVVEVTGHQFAWDFRYPGKDGILGKKNYKLYNKPAGNSLAVDFEDDKSWDDLKTNQLYLPVGQPVKMVINAQDVIHNVGLPHFRMKMDAVPGIPTTQWFTPQYTTAEMKKRTGNPNFTYEISCDQICGPKHFSMRGVIVVVTKEEYDQWLSEQKPDYLTMFPEKDPSAKPTIIDSAANKPMAAIVKK